jgi:hypothetical protein
MPQRNQKTAIDQSGEIISAPKMMSQGHDRKRNLPAKKKKETSRAFDTIRRRRCALIIEQLLGWLFFFLAGRVGRLI